MKQNALVEIDSSSLSSKSSTTTHSSFQDLWNGWQQVSSANSAAASHNNKKGEYGSSSCKLGVGLKQLDQRQQNGSNKGIVMKSSRYVRFLLI